MTHMTQETKKIHSQTRSETRHMKADNPKALDVLNEIRTELLKVMDNDPLVARVSKIMIDEFKIRTTKP